MFPPACSFTAAALTQRPGEVELGPRSLYGEEGVGEPSEEGGVANKMRVHVVPNGQRASHQQEEEHAAAADQQLAADGLLETRQSGKSVSVENTDKYININIHL